MVSKDSKRRRKETETPLPQTTTAAAATTANTTTAATATTTATTTTTNTAAVTVESSPEMPKRTKVQAQRKFAQGQSAPTSTYNSIIAASSSSNTGPSTSSESREPPTELLPNKRPKTDDFLTFLCFRGTSALPAHLDFLNQGQPKEAETTNTKKNPPKGAKRGRKPKQKSTAASAAAAATTTTTTSETTQPTAEENKVENEAAATQPNSATAEEKKSTATSAETKTDAADDNVTSTTTTITTQQTTAAAAAAAAADPDDEPIMSFAVRKRAEVVTDGNRRGRASDRQLRNTPAEASDKCNSSPETKRRSNRTKEGKGVAEPTSEDEDEIFSAQDDVPISESAKPAAAEATDNKTTPTNETKSKSAKSTTPLDENKTQSPPKDVDVAKTRKGRPPATPKTKEKETPKDKDTTETETTKQQKAVAPKAEPAASSSAAATKEKPAPAKRPRQKESPIFIPSPEPSGRMTRQRAFFEPVKVIHHDDAATAAAPATSEPINNNTSNPSETVEAKPDIKTEDKAAEEDAKANLESTKDSKSNDGSSVKSDKNKANLNIFDFSSDDEQPLAKTMKIKKGKTSPKKVAATGGARGRKPSPKKAATDTKPTIDDASVKKEEVKAEITKPETVATVKAETQKPDVPVEPSQSTPNTTAPPKATKRGKPVKKKGNAAVEESTEHSDCSPPANKKQLNARQPRKSNTKKSAAEQQQQEQPEDSTARSSSPTPQARNQRPSRKTKEAATIYMGIIGHKLQMADDEDDDCSMSSFPELPNVKETEKMELELKKNASQAGTTPATTTPAASTTPAQQPSNTTPATAEKQQSARRGRPPKLGKVNAAKKPAAEQTNKKSGTTAATAAANKAESTKSKEPGKVDSDDEEDYLLNEEVNETKRKLEKSFSDSDDEPLAIKVNVKATDKDAVDAEQQQRQTTNSTAATTQADTPQQTQPASTSGNNNSSSNATTQPNTAAGTAPPANTATQKATASTGTPPIPQSMHIPANSSPSPIAQQVPAQAPPSPFKTIEKKSPVPTSKILNVPATYAIPNPMQPTAPIVPPGVPIALPPGAPVPVPMPPNYQKPPGAYLPQPGPHYHVPRTPTHQFVPTGKPPPGPAPMPPQQQLKYPPAPAPSQYQPPIEAYPSPKINPTFLTPKFDRTTLPPRPNNNNFPSPSPVKFDGNMTPRPMVMSGNGNGNGAGGLVGNNGNGNGGNGGNCSIAPNQNIIMPLTQNKINVATNTNPNAVPNVNIALAAPPLPTATVPAPMPTTPVPTNVQATASTSAAAAASAVAAAATASADPLKDEIGSILAANLMPSKEESGKIFGIASVSLAQSSGPDNTKCTLGKCGSIHKPVLGPVVPTESYFGDTLSSKERRKAKVNMTHEQIQKWLIECSSNPDEIQDDLDDDFDDNLRPNLFPTTPPPTRDDKESTSFSSSSKNTRDHGKSECAWSTKGPSLKATPVLAHGNKKEPDINNHDESANDGVKVNLVTTTTPQKSNTKAQAGVADNKDGKDQQKADKKSEKKSKDEHKAAPTEKQAATPGTKSQKQQDKQQQQNAKGGGATVASKAAAANDTNAKQNSQQAGGQKRRKAGATAAQATASTPTTTDTKTSTSNSNLTSTATSSTTKTAKRTPVYNQNKKQNIQLKEGLTTSHKKSAPFSYSAFSADNERSVYSFDKDDDDGEDGTNPGTGKPAGFRRRPDGAGAPEAGEQPPNTPANRSSPTKRRAAAERAKADIAAQNVLSPADSSSKLTKPSLESEKPEKVAEKAPPAAKGKAAKNTKKANVTDKEKAPAATDGNANDSDSEGHTYYIPLQGNSTGAAGNGKQADGSTAIQGVTVKLGREGPEGPNQKIFMNATLVTNASKSGATAESTTSNNNNADAAKKTTAANAVPATNSTTNNVKSSAPVVAVQPRAKASDASATQQATTSTGAANLVRVNSNSSLFSGSNKSKAAAAAAGGAAAASSTGTNAANKKFKDDTPIKMSNNTAFPRHDDPTQMVEAPIFRPTEKEFADPIEFIERITPIAARFGICKIIPPSTFKPECRISDEMRFTAYNQYVHKMLHRWGPSAKELSAIKKYLATQSIIMNQPPWIGGMEVDLPRLYHTVQELGGLKEVIEKKKWARVAEEMCIPKLAQDRVTKLDDIYCKYLLPYDTLSPAERQKLFDEVEADWAKREARARRNADRFVHTESVSNEEDDMSSEDEEESEEEIDGVSMECIVKGRNMPLSQFYRIARNTMALWFKNTEPTVNEVEAEFWRHVAVRDSHVCVHSGSIDSSGWGYGFPSPGPKGKGSNYARHPWNLKVLTNNPGSVLRSLGPVMGVTVPTLHVGMLFSACCWYRDPHGLSWIEYLHTGASKLWYGIPDDQSANFRAALTSLIPTHCQNKTIWLPCDTVMVPPHMLTDRGVSLCRIEQKPGEFIVVFPRAYTSSLATGYVVSESVYFATTSWLDLAKDDFRDIHESCEPAMFSLEQLLFALGYDQRVTTDTLQQMLPMLHEVHEKESAAREQLKAAGVISNEKAVNEKQSKAKKQQPPFKSIDSECDLCRANLFISMVRTDDGNVYCLQHALKNLNNGNIQAKNCKLIYAYNVEDIMNLITQIKTKIEQKRNSLVNKKAK